MDEPIRPVDKINCKTKDGIVTFSGGSAANSFVDDFNNLSHSLTYAIAVSDNGGSSSELIRGQCGCFSALFPPRMLSLWANGSSPSVWWAQCRRPAEYDIEAFFYDFTIAEPGDFLPLRGLNARINSQLG